MPKVKISNRIKQLHPKSPIAGLTLEVAILTLKQKKVNAYLATYGEKIEDMTPVKYNNHVWYVENEFVIKVDNSL